MMKMSMIMRNFRRKKFMVTGTEKKTRKVKGCDMASVSQGKKATVYLEDGRVAITSPVVTYFVSGPGGYIYIETENTIYTNK